MSWVAFCSSSLATRRRWVESIAIAALAAVGFACFRSDPFLLRADVPWLIFLPLLCGLQHGLGPGLLSASLLVAGAGAHAWWSATLSSSPFSSWALGCLLAGALSGEFRNKWAARHDALEAQNARLRKDGERLHRRNQAFTVSHARLEQQLSAEHWSLESSLRDAARRMEAAAGLAERFRVALDVFATHGTVAAAALYTRGAHGRLQPIPAAVLGSPRLGAGAEHPLVQRAFSSTHLVSLVQNGRLEPADDAVLAAVPLVNAQDDVLAVLAIHDMPFFSFHDEHLNNLMLLGAHLADMVQDPTVAHALDAASRTRKASRARSAGERLDPSSARILAEVTGRAEKPRSTAPN